MEKPEAQSAKRKELAAKPALDVFRKLEDEQNQYLVGVAQHAVRTLSPEEAINEAAKQ
ncbi:MAG: hypothetical protein NTZ09_08025 [Candidatus Hydrogenedentes bacterium]|nr:hypothetical protein [Candidatus Hydrogenedentota bacterium]